jgi:hypothetical protein
MAMIYIAYGMDAGRIEPPEAATAGAIRARLGALSADASLLAEEGFRARSDAMDILEDEILAPLHLHPHPPNPFASLRAEAERLLESWESLDAALFRKLRAKLLAASDPGAAFRESLESHFPARERRGPIAPAGYDALDAFLNGLLHPDPLPAESLPLEPGMVDYRKTPARIALELFERCGLAPGETFCDVGSGPGQIPLLAHLLTGARAIGIEREPAYPEYARACAAALGLAEVDFLALDARAADYGPVDVLFLYTPFRDGILAEVLERVRSQAREGLRIFALGPCAADLAAREWLVPWDQGPESGSGLRGFVLKGAE